MRPGLAMLAGRCRPATSAARHPVGGLLGTVGLLGLYLALMPVFGAHGAQPALVLAVYLAAGIGSIAGFAFSAICAALMLPFGGDMVRLVQIMMVSSIAIQGLSLWALRGALEWRALPPFLLGGLAGAPLGVHLLLTTDPRRLVSLLGLLVLAYGAWTFFAPPLRLRNRLGVAADVLAGAASGMLGGLAALPSTAVVIWTGLQGWPKERQRGLYQPFILVMQVCNLLLSSAMASGVRPPAGLDPSLLLYVPPAVLGTCCGLCLFGRLSDRQFKRAVNLLLIVSGLGLLF